MNTATKRRTLAFRYRYASTYLDELAQVWVHRKRWMQIAATDVLAGETAYSAASDGALGEIGVRSR